MIIHHQSNVAAFAGNHKYWFLPQQIIVSRVTVTSAAPTNQLIEQARSIHRFVMTRVHGRVN